MTAPFRLISGNLGQTQNLRAAVLGWRQLQIASDADSRARHFVVLTPENLVVGCASCGPESFSDESLLSGRAMRFWGVAVLESYRQVKLGDALMRAILARGAELEIDLIWANVRTSALSFYTNLNFEVIGEPFTDKLTGLVDRRVALVISGESTRGSG